MPHLEFIRPDAQYPGELVPNAADFQRFDSAQARIIDGDDGGIWTPTSPIIIGGAGVTFDTANTQITGGITTSTGGRLVLANASGNVPVFNTPMTDTICMSCVDALSPGATIGAGNSWFQDDYLKIIESPAGVQTILSTATLFVPIPRRYLHQGASLSKAVLHFRVPTKPANNSVIGSPAFGVYVYDPATQSQLFTAPYVLADGLSNTWQPSTTYPTLGYYVVPPITPSIHTNGFYYKVTTTGTSGSNPAIFDGVTTVGHTVTDGSVVWTCTGHSGQLPAFGVDASGYYNNGQPQQIELDFDNANNTLLALNAVDHSTYTYGILVTGAGDLGQTLPDLNIILHSVALTFSNIVDMQFS